MPETVHYSKNYRKSGFGTFLRVFERPQTAKRRDYPHQPKTEILLYGLRYTLPNYWPNRYFSLFQKASRRMRACFSSLLPRLFPSLWHYTPSGLIFDLSLIKEHHWLLSLYSVICAYLTIQWMPSLETATKQQREEKRGKCSRDSHDRWQVSPIWEYSISSSKILPILFPWHFYDSSGQKSDFLRGQAENIRYLVKQGVIQTLT